MVEATALSWERYLKVLCRRSKEIQQALNPNPFTFMLADVSACQGAKPPAPHARVNQYLDPICPAKIPIIRYSVTVNISRFHREARGSIPRTGG